MKSAEEKIEFEEYSFQNIYIITTYRCNWSCDFCLFKFNQEEECDIQEVIDRLSYAISDSPKKVYIKITGGEPFLRQDLLEEIFKFLNLDDKVYKVGIGTNGSIPLGSYFNNVKVRTHIFLSRHHINDSLPSVKDLKGNINNPLIDFRINCNLIKGQVDSAEKIEQFIEAKKEFTHFCFRELSSIDIDNSSMYPKEIYSYQDYYNKHLIKVGDIEKTLPDSFKLSRVTGNFYDTNRWYWYKDKISVKFRTISESRLIEFNKNTDKVDEYVIHPDGTLTGCWDKDIKILLGKESIYAK